MKTKAAICRVNKSLPIDEARKMNEMNVNHKLQVDREIGECMVHLTFSDQNNPVIVKTVLYTLTDVFEKRVMLNKGLV